VLTPGQALEAVNARFGRHAGRRALHAKGTVCSGTFTAAEAAARLTRAAHMQGDPVPATARVSNGSGDPGEPDYAPDVRGLAVKFHLPDGSRTDILAQSSARFPVRTPEAFVDLIRAATPGPSLLLRLPAFIATHREMLRALPALQAATRPPASYATCDYYAIHAFKWIDAAGDGRFVRYRWRPQAGAEALSPKRAKQLGRDYLQEEIAARLARERVRFDLELQLARPGDRVDDPSAVWPESRETVIAGTLELTGLDTTRETGGDVLVFDPLRLTDGIQPSDDPVLQFRPRAYSSSIAARTAAAPAPAAVTPEGTSAGHATGPPGGHAAR
jgi:catalase